MRVYIKILVFLQCEYYIRDSLTLNYPVSTNCIMCTPLLRKNNCLILFTKSGVIVFVLKINYVPFYHFQPLSALLPSLQLFMALQY